MTIEVRLWTQISSLAGVLKKHLTVYGPSYLISTFHLSPPPSISLSADTPDKTIPSLYLYILTADAERVFWQDPSQTHTQTHILTPTSALTLPSLMYWTFTIVDIGHCNKPWALRSPVTAQTLIYTWLCLFSYLTPFPNLLSC